MAKLRDRWDVETDIVVVGSGTGALTCAIVAQQRGAQVALLEASDKLGGGTAYSGGMIWVANNHHMAEEGLADSREEGLAYLRAMSAGRHVEEVAQAYIDAAPKALKYLEENTELEMELIRPSPDYYAEFPGGKMEGRYLVPKPWDSKKLGDWQPNLRLSPHLPLAVSFSEMKQWGGYANMAQWDWALIDQRMKEGIVGFGPSLIGPLMRACLDRKVNIMLQTRASELYQDVNGRVIGVRAEQEGRFLSIHGRVGVVLACGGYEWNEDLRHRTGSLDTLAYSVPTNRGDMHIAALEIGAAWEQLDDAGGPCLAVPGEVHEGLPLYRVFVLEPARPGMILVNRQGRRFADEAFWRSVDEEQIHRDAATQSYPNFPCFTIYDQGHKNKYTIGTTMPQDKAPDWMNGSSTLRELASKLKINPDNLEETIANFNQYAKEGKDPFFRRGETAYDRHWGDSSHKPNPTLGPIEKPPFYGFQLVRASGGTRSGLVINGKAQVLNLRGEVIPGLYATPNVAAHLALGLGLTSGQTNAQSMTFGYIAASHATEGLVK